MASHRQSIRAFNAHTLVYLGALTLAVTMVTGCSTDDDCYYVSIPNGTETIKIQIDKCCLKVNPPKCITIYDFTMKCTIIWWEPDNENNNGPTAPYFPETLTTTVKHSTKDDNDIYAQQKSTVVSAVIHLAVIVGLIVIIGIMVAMSVRWSKSRATPPTVQFTSASQRSTQNLTTNNIPILISRRGMTPNDSCNHSTVNIEGGGVGSELITDRETVISCPLPEWGGVKPTPRIRTDDQPPSYERIYGPSPPLQSTLNSDNLPPPPKYEDVV